MIGLALYLYRCARFPSMSITGSYQGEPTLHQGSATPWRGGQPSGWRLLAPRRRLFGSHNISQQNEPVESPGAVLRGSELCHTLGLVPSGLRAHLTSSARSAAAVEAKQLAGAR